MSKARAKAAVKNKPAKTGSQVLISRTDVFFIIAIILIAFTVRYISLTDNGVTSDEPIYISTGVQYIYNLLNLQLDGQSWAGNLEHPPVSKYIYGAAAFLVSGYTADFDMVVAAKLASLCMGVITCVLVYLIGRDFFDSRTGFSAALILALLPTFIAHTQVATLESPLVLFITLTMYLYLLAVKNNSRKLFLASAVSFGLVLSTKYNGLLILPVLIGFFLVYRLAEIRAREGRLDVKTLKSNASVLVPAESIITFLGLALILFFVLWPFLWTGPVGRIQVSLDHWTYDITEYFFGTRMAPPIYYYPVYFLVTLPALLLIPLAIGLWDTLKSRNPFKLAMLLWFLVPFGYCFSSFIQDGIRYIFMIYPAVALLCAFGLWQAAGWLSQAFRQIIKSSGERFKHVTATSLFWALTALATVYLIITAASIYPYYLDYYNEFTGGPKNVQEHRLFKFSWWGEGIKECMDWVGENSPQNATVMMLTLPEDPANTFFFQQGRNYIYPWLSTSNTYNKEYRFSEEPYQLNQSGTFVPVVPDYVIINQKMMEDFNDTFNDPEYSVVYTATVQGAPLVQVYKKTGV